MRMQRALPTLAGREFKVGVGVGTTISIVVGLIFIFLGGSIDDAPPIIPSAPVWVGTLLVVEALALTVAWGGLTLYFGRFQHDAPSLSHRPIVLGLVAGAFGGALLLIVSLWLNQDGGDSASTRRRRGKPPSTE
jgi:hypothetical protein